MSALQEGLLISSLLCSGLGLVCVIAWFDRVATFLFGGAALCVALALVPQVGWLRGMVAG